MDLVWGIGIMFAIGFIPMDTERNSWIDAFLYISLIVLAWPVCVGITLRRQYREMKMMMAALKEQDKAGST